MAPVGPLRKCIKNLFTALKSLWEKENLLAIIGESWIARTVKKKPWRN
jgi:hypothetical protein